MSIISRVFGLLGEEGITPRRVQMLVTDSFASVTSAGYLTQATVSPDAIYPTDIFDITYAFNVATGQGVYGQFLPVIGANGIITLVPAQATNAITSWTPALSFGGSSVGITYSIQTGFYTLNGNLCHFNVSLQLTSKGAAVGVAAISLPFATTQVMSAPLVVINTTFTNSPFVYTSANTSTMAVLQNISNAGTVQLTNAEFANATGIFVTGTYFIAPRLN